MEFTDEELEILESWGLALCVPDDAHANLFHRITGEIAQRKELANIDFNECEGGACTL